MQTSIGKEFHFSYAHRIMNHPGKCRNLHGHNAKVEVSISGEVDPETHMVIDFSELDMIVKKLINKWDHKTILHHEDPLATILDESELFLIGTHPTAEEFATELATYIQHNLNMPTKVRFYETVNCFAEVVTT